jgi:hypothetical protein
MAEVLQPIRADLARLQADVDALRADLNAMRADVGHIRRLAAIVKPSLRPLPAFLTGHMQTWNRGCGSSQDAALEVVPFLNGDDPTTGDVICLNSCLRVALLITSNPAQSPASSFEKAGAGPVASPP